MNKNSNMFTKLAVITALIFTMMSCSNGHGPIKAELYTGKDIKITGTANDIDYTIELKSIELELFSDPCGDWFELYYEQTKKSTNKKTKITKLSTEPISYRIKPNKDSEGIFFIWSMYRNKNNDIEEVLERVPVKMENNTVSFTLTFDNFMIGKHGRSEELKFEFTKQ